MIIETRYRDIPMSEIQKYHGVDPIDDAAAWNQCRGKAIQIRIPGTTDAQYPCDQLHYTVVKPVLKQPPGTRIWTCSHMAEIGD